MATWSIAINSLIQAPTTPEACTLPVMRSNQSSLHILESRHEGFELPVDGVKSGKLTVETLFESNSMSRHDSEMVLENLRGQASNGETRRALSTCAGAGAHLLIP
jgi:hypothetical protein